MEERAAAEVQDHGPNTCPYIDPPPPAEDSGDVSDLLVASEVVLTGIDWGLASAPLYDGWRDGDQYM